MEETDKNLKKHTNGLTSIENGATNVLCKQIESNQFVWQETVTVINLCEQKLSKLENNVKLPANITHLDLSHNTLDEVPNVVLNLKKLVVLNLSHNAIEYFDDCPQFCHTLEHLDMSDNCLAGPPYWVFAETPQNLVKLNLNNNNNLTKSFIDGYFEELLQYSTLVTDVSIQNCRLGRYIEFLGTFSKAETVCVGTEEYSTHTNSLIEMPCPGLDKCCDLKSLKVSNTNIYTVSSSIEMYKYLVEINLAHNDIRGLPNEFCKLESLEVCKLSDNKILYLPEDMHKLQKLEQLYIDSNNLCMIPDTLKKLCNLKVLDLYDNHLDEVPDLEYVNVLDLAQNYCEEPDNEIYLEKKEKLRLLRENRFNGRKNDITRTDDSYSERSSRDEDDEELYEIFNSGKKIDSPPNTIPASSPEDWDSDDFWVPSHINPLPKTMSPWLCFVKQKIKEGNFCPMDAHADSVVEKIRYEKACNPQVFQECEGQFDDYSSDDT